MPNQIECTIGDAPDPGEGELRIGFDVTNGLTDILPEIAIYLRSCNLRQTQLQQGADVCLEAGSSAEEAIEVSKGGGLRFGVALHEPARTS